MTTIAYKNGILAADRLAQMAGWGVEITKIQRLPDGRLLGGAGNMDFLLQMYDWIATGEDPARFPSTQANKEDWEPILCVMPDGTLLRYERTPYPLELHTPFYAAGSGRDFALAAMHLGKSAPEAVAVASELDLNTGRGVDTLTVPSYQVYLQRKSAA
jgi:hypothetical protein